MNDKWIVLLSGGMDSATALAWALRQADIIALSFHYGQRHTRELSAAQKLVHHYSYYSLPTARHILLSHQLVDVSFIGDWKGSVLTDETRDVPACEEDLGQTDVGLGRAAVTYVPCRNAIFIALAAGYAETVGASTIVIGVNYIDAGGYPDCRPEFVEAINRLLEVGTRDQPKVIAPLVEMTKSEIVELGEALGVPWGKTWSCYKGETEPCSTCNACVQRAKGFTEADIVDPLLLPLSIPF